MMHIPKKDVEVCLVKNQEVQTAMFLIHFETFGLIFVIIMYLCIYI